MAYSSQFWSRVAAAFAAVMLVLTMMVGESLAVPAHAAGHVSVDALTVSHKKTPYGVSPALGNAHAPRFSWTLASADRGVWQERYQIRVADSVDGLNASPIWDTGWVAENESTLIPYSGDQLEPRTRYYWQVRVETADGSTSDWSETTWFETGLAASDDWEADWISAPGNAEFADGTVELDVTVDPETAFGVYLRSSNSAAYMWQLNDGGDSGSDGPMFRPHGRTTGGLSTIDEISLEPFVGADVFESEVNFRIEFDGNRIITYVNGVKVDERTDSTAEKGAIGLRTNGSEAGVVSRISISDGDEAILDADLREDANPFDGGSAVPGEGVRVSGDSEVFLRDPSSSPMLRKNVHLVKDIASARLYASALGVYEYRINGERVGDEELAPGWTDYSIRTQYQTYDVTDMLTKGDNALGILAGPGWYSGHLAWFGPEQYGNATAVSGFVTIEFTDGSTQTISTDDTWRSAESPITYSDLLMGETYDARLEQAGWDSPGFDDSSWQDAKVSEVDPTDTLVAQVDPPVRSTEERPAISMSEPEEGVWVFDLGQNMVGRARVKISGEAGQTVRLRHAEVTHPDGNIAPENLRSAKATDYYTFAEDGEANYEPRFTFHGFRYLELTGLSEEPSIEDVTGVVLHTDGELTGSFETSDPMVNQLQSNIVWGQRGNFLSIPTDTPARDERLGWTGDINVFAPTATFNMDSAAFLRKWMDDLRDAQLSNGAYPEVAPQFCTDSGIHPSCGGGSTGWADAGITVPWSVWQRYGDTQIIEENYESMTAYIDFLKEEAPDHIRSSYGSWGDWLNFDDPTPANVLATAFYAHSVDLMSRMSQATGRTGDAEQYRALFEAIREAYIEAFLSEDGTINGDSQTGYAISIEFGLVPDELLEKVGDRLAEAVARRDGHLATGFLGTPSLLPALSTGGHPELSYELLLNRTFPSWGFQIDRGATTMWERWDSIKEDGSFGDLAMNSFNHFAYGAVGDWMYRDIAGISELEPGHKKTLIAPKPGGGLSYAKASYESIQGTIASHWEITDGGFRLDVTIPANTSARVELPASNAAAVLESDQPALEATGVQDITIEDETAQVEILSGTYSFFVDDDLGLFGELADAIEVLEEEAAHANLSESLAGELTDLVAELRTVKEDAREAYMDGQEITAAERIHDGLAAVDEVVGEVDDEALNEAIAGVDEILAQLSAIVLKVSAEVHVPEETVIPGGQAVLNLLMSNDGEAKVRNLAWATAADIPWTAEPDRAEFGDLAAGEQAEGHLGVRVPTKHEPGAQMLGTVVTYEFNGSTASLPFSSSVQVGPALEIDSVSFSPEAPQPGQTVTAHVKVKNKADGDLNAHARIGIDEEESVAGATEKVPANDTATLEVDLLVPFEATHGSLPVTVHVADGELTYARTQSKIDVDLGDLDVREYDFIDLGNAESEEAHNLKASEDSGTQPDEAGKTRRYTSREDPNGFFEFDMEVPAGEPFVVQVMETFDGDRLKNYHVLVDGVKVYDRYYQREGGKGLYTYQFIVDDAEALDNDGTVTVRFQNNDEAADYDPSIAEVRTLEFHDYIDLGDYQSEQEHNLSASDNSGTNVEAGKTRRYADREDPDGQYEFDLAVTPGESFLIRGIETYDRDHAKEYDVFINDILVHQRLFTHTGGEGLETYQFVVADPEALDNDGTVRIRFQNNAHGRNYDASLAELWAVPLGPDETAPMVSATVEPHTAADGWHAATPEVTLTALDDRPGKPEIEYRLVGGAWGAYTAPFTVGEGVTTVEYKATDAAGNTSEVRELVVQVDIRAPEVTAEIHGTQTSGWYGPGAALLIEATDEDSGVGELQYRLEEVWLTYDEPVELSEGTHEIEVRARDRVGHWSTTSTLAAQVDGTPPVVNMDVAPEAADTGWHTSHPQLTVEAADNVSGVEAVEIRLNGEWEAYTGPVTLTDGVHTIAYRATDVAGNTTTPATATVKVDAQEPTLEATVNDNRELEVAAEDSTSGIDYVEYSIDGGATWRTCTGSLTVPSHITEIQVRGFDRAGWESEVAIIGLIGITLDPQAGHPGDDIAVEVAGLEPGSKVTIDPQVDDVVAATADDEGRVTQTFTIAEDAEPGTYLVAADGDSQSVTAELTVVAEGEELPPPEETPGEGQHPDEDSPTGSLPTAGTTVGWLLLGAILLAAVGALTYSHHRGRSRE